ncbi:M23 family metallopeptidase [Nitrosovibrio tenuis]|uniref:Murein DD-endopeptidase MepM and murein hydrolase activator NlpD, contain LysM domain n=1 Tax=Nitrosovibrio tenuis TaxID=1233 RepID=A0A1H7N9Y2_9PROT|nr:M23 family metallopeptidase [Nitrosovibrio tenuis]SEL20274.1 Murein DD-endopeptidase MepM and murein hydrolase activator NlpD, contain LysM domain [Nitrosovibrio tenuis]
MRDDKSGLIAQKPLALTKKRLRWLILLSSFPLFGMMAAFGIAPDTSLEDLPVQQVVLGLDLPEIHPSFDTNLEFRRQERIQRGDTIATLLSRLEVDNKDVVSFLRDARNVKAMHQLVPGKIVHVQTNAMGQLLWLRYFPGGSEQLMMEKSDGGFKTSEQPAQLETHIQMKSGVINSSLFAAVDSAGVPESIALQIVDILASDIDFHRDLRKGDRFTVVYDSLYCNGEPARPGRVLAVEFVNQGTPHRALYFQAESGESGYYAPDGKNLRKAFLRSPLEFSRISSGFSSARFHPILKTWRAHSGIDYAAPTGTRVKAAADGTVALAGWQGGYGNVVILQHQGTYSTVYGHLSAFAKGLRKGQRVSQGDVIGHVGATGMATGPHLHYEFRFNGVQRDPLKVAMPAAHPVLARHMPTFYEHTKPLMARLDMLRGTNLAFLD